MAEIILADLMAWMPTLRPLWQDNDDRAWSARTISWAVAARTETPLLPALRGGEIIVVSPRTVADQGLEIGEFAAHLGRSGCAAMVLLGGDSASVPIDIPWLELASNSRPSAVEGEINRLLTEQRGLLYSRGTDLGRALLGALTEGATPTAIAALGATTTGIPMVLEETAGSPMCGGDDARQREVGTHLVVAVGAGAWLRLGPLPPASRAFAALAGERVGEAVETALRRADLLKPRGKARASAMRSLLLGEALPGAAAALGMTANSNFRVALADARASIREAGRLAGAAVLLHEADLITGHVAAVLEWPGSRRPTTLPFERVASALGEGSWLALSEEVGLGGLADATAQARFVASLVARGEVAGPVVAFDAMDRVGVHRLLYLLRDDPELARFVETWLAALRQEDGRGVLRDTLRSYLAAGGAGVETAARLGIHRNTLAYRLRRIAALTGRDPTDPKHWLAYGLALAGDRLLGSG
ncbi:MAG: helix-turn-helix domain-containing protein [Chloroflexia bacterium]|nr:helix-turn-helix domain-containing protein [Chloroflexia bacterium]